MKGEIVVRVRQDHLGTKERPRGARQRVSAVVGVPGEGARHEDAARMGEMGKQPEGFEG